MLISLRSERGASALIVAGSLVMLFGIAAVAVDAGANFNNRRGSQTAADTAVMAGALNFGDPGEATTQILAFAESNLDVTYSSAEWRALWTACTDATRPANFSSLPPPSGWGGGTLDCISQSANEIRVRIPDQLIDTSFGQVLGITTMRASAIAVATVRPRAGGGLLPFAVRGGESTGEICIQTAAGGIAKPPCDGPSRGSFGTVLSPWFGNEEIGTSAQCNSLGGLVDDNIARGIDHFIGVYEDPAWGYPRVGGPPSNNDTRSSDANVDDCSIVSGIATATDGVPIDTLLIDTGNVANAVTQGLATGSGSYTALLAQSGPYREIRNGSASLQLNNVPLWSYLLPGNAGGVSACNAGSISSQPDIQAKNAAMSACLSAAATAGSVIFSDSISSSPRFSWAPQVWFNTFGSGQRFNPVYQYRQVYLAGTFINCPASGACPIEFYPGDGTTPMCDPQGPNCRTITINQQTAFLLPDGSTSDNVNNTFPGGNLGPFEPELSR